MTNSVTVNFEDIIRKQGVPDKCDYCGDEFVWLISIGVAQCPRCLMQQYRTSEEIANKRARWNGEPL